MPADRLLNNVLQHYQDVHDDAKTDQIVGSTVHLLTELSNPLNLSLLTSHLLTAPAIWQRPDALRMALRVISIYNSAALQLHNRATEGPTQAVQVGKEAWTRAVVKGADDKSRRWQHLLVLTGVLMGFEAEDRRGLSSSLRNTLEGAVVTAANLALEQQAVDGPVASGSIVLALNYVFPLLSAFHQSQLNSDTLLPTILWAITDVEGFRGGDFLDAIIRDAGGAGDAIIHWPPHAISHVEMQRMDQRPLMNIMGPLSKLAAFAVHNASDFRVVVQAQEQLLGFSKKLLDAWSRGPFQNIDPMEESTRLGLETFQTTWPALWQLLRKALFGIVAVLQPIVSRSLLDPALLQERLSAEIAIRSLHILRNLSFISSRNGNSLFQIYTFAYLTSIDMLSRSVPACESFLRETRPSDAQPFPSNHLGRTLDLFYLNLAEHLPLTLPTPSCDELIIKPASLYLSHEGAMTPAMVELFESAHSAVLSVLSCPQHSAITITTAPFYIVRLFESFPRRISPRQFRVAFKTVMQIVSPPFPIASLEPHLSETLLDMLRAQATSANTMRLPSSNESAAGGPDAAALESPMSEQSSLVLALIDSLPFLPLPLLEEWLTVAAEAMSQIGDPSLRGPVRERFLDILVSGELDVERAAIGVAWWGTKGGRQLVLGAGNPQPAMMSGALRADEHNSRL